MIIKIEDYELVQKNEVFTLIWNKPCKKTVIDEETGVKTLVDEEGRTRPVTMGVKLTLEQCLTKIIAADTSSKELTVSLEEWLKEYKNSLNKFSEQFSKVFRPDEGSIKNN